MLCTARICDMNKKQTIFDKQTSQSLKGIAIIMMMLHHNFYEYDESVCYWPITRTQASTISDSFKICVAIFAFISGYGLFLNYQKQTGEYSSSKWCLQRYLKTFSNYWFVWVLLIPFCQLMDGRTASTYMQGEGYSGVVYMAIDFLGLAKLFGTPKLTETWWYMSAAFVFIILLPVVYKFHDDLILVLLFVMIFIRVVFMGHSESAFTGENLIYPFITPFLLGCIFARYKLFDHWDTVGRNRWERVYRLIIEIWLVIVGYKLYHNIPKEVIWEYHYGIYTSLVILMCVDIIMLVPFLSKILNGIGKHSTNIFLTHTFLQFYFKDQLMVPRHFLLITLLWFFIAFMLSMVIESLKKITRYNNLINWLGLMIAKI